MKKKKLALAFPIESQKYEAACQGFSGVQCWQKKKHLNPKVTAVFMIMNERVVPGQNDQAAYQ